MHWKQCQWIRNDVSACNAPTRLSATPCQAVRSPFDPSFRIPRCWWAESYGACGPRQISVHRLLLLTRATIRNPKLRQRPWKMQLSSSAPSSWHPQSPHHKMLMLQARPHGQARTRHTVAHHARAWLKSGWRSPAGIDLSLLRCASRVDSSAVYETAPPGGSAKAATCFTSGRTFIRKLPTRLT